MRRRQGFTLVELLVALALIVFIMAILSQAFATATKTFRDLKAAGDLAERLRMVTARLHRDLAASHFNSGGGQTVHLSDLNFWQNASNGQNGTPGPYTGGGFFTIYQGQMPGTNPALDYLTEGTQVTGVPSTRTTSHGMHFTVNLGGTDLGDIFSTTAAANTWAPRLDSSQFSGTVDARFMDPRIPSSSTAPPSLYNYTWAEVAYFLRPSINPITGVQDDANGTPLFNLYARRRLAVQDNSLVNWVQPQPPGTPPQGWTVPTPDGDYPELSTEYEPPTMTTIHCNSPTDLNVPQRRFGYNKNSPPQPTDSIMPQDLTQPQGINPTGGPLYPTLSSNPNNPALQNADLLLTDVISFEVRMLFGDPNYVPPAQNPPRSPPPYIPTPAQPFMTLWDLQAALQQAQQAGTGYQPFQTGRQVQQMGSVLVFDTWSQTTDSTFGDYSLWSNRTSATPSTDIPLWNPNWNSGQGNGPIILAIQVTIRIWDRKSQLTRQATLVQAM